MEIIEKIKKLTYEIIKDTTYYLYDVEYTKENEENFLRIYIDKDSGITIDDCVSLTEKVASKLDEEDFIKERYYLEICSPGAERILRNLEEIKRSKGKYVLVKTYEKINGIKEFLGYLENVNDIGVTINYKYKNKCQDLKIEYKKISKIRLAIKI